jgi:NAD(P)-dependent dehydrogenase (short-subunit alcohol dehydrogenase family)
MQPYDLGSDYAAVKAGVGHLAVGVSKHLANSGVTAVTIPPQPRRSGPGLELRRTCEEIEVGLVRDILPNTGGRVAASRSSRLLVAWWRGRSMATSMAQTFIDGGYVVGIECCYMTAGCISDIRRGVSHLLSNKTRRAILGHTR